MKKLFVILMSVVALTAFVSCNDKPVTPDNLPSKAKTFLKTYFPDVDVFSVIKEEDGDYDVNLTDGTDVDFRSNGNWKKVDCHNLPVPHGFYPAGIDTYMADHYVGGYIEEIEFENNRYKVSLVDATGFETDFDLVFDKNGNYIGIDD
ncbi:MAG: PepSY-like domain-containing protein [Bacteroidales bacterium]|nr:PepSY-like domain-containing protein [Bacteroidales bacterium]